MSLSETYIEEEPTVSEWLQKYEPTTPRAVEYLLSLIPFISWIGRYNFTWLYGDLIAGITVGCVVIPQGSEFPASFPHTSLYPCVDTYRG